MKTQAKISAQNFYGGSRETRLMVVLSLMLLDRYGGDEILKARLIDIVFAQAIATYADELRKQD